MRRPDSHAVFATILGALPRPPLSGRAETAAANVDGVEVRLRRLADDEAISEALMAQARAGLEPLTDGRLRWRTPLQAMTGFARDWEFAAGVSTRAVKQALPGPYSLGWTANEAEGTRSVAARRRATLAHAEALNAEARALRDAGCPLVEIDEPGAIRIGDQGPERRLFIDAHRRLTEGLDDVHLSLILSGGNADTAGAATFFDLPYASYAVDLIAGPDNWRLVTAAPADRGIVCGALGPGEHDDDGPELLVWAAHYAASANGRGLARVGIANAPGLEHTSWEAAQRKFVRLADAARIAALESAGELAEALDPRAVNSRSAALGRVVPANPPRRRSGSAP
jgi:methionine synthase II (cobalamin-independent)